MPDYPQAIQNEIEKLQKWQERIIKSLPTFLIAMECEEQFSELNIVPNIDFVGDVDIKIGFVRSLKSITKVLRWLGKKGYRQSALRPPDK